MGQGGSHQGSSHGRELAAAAARHAAAAARLGGPSRCVSGGSHQGSSDPRTDIWPPGRELPGGPRPPACRGGSSPGMRGPSRCVSERLPAQSAWLQPAGAGASGAGGLQPTSKPVPEAACVQLIWQNRVRPDVSSSSPSGPGYFRPPWRLVVPDPPAGPLRGQVTTSHYEILDGGRLLYFMYPPPLPSPSFPAVSVLQANHDTRPERPGSCLPPASVHIARRMHGPLSHNQTHVCPRGR